MAVSTQFSIAVHMMAGLGFLPDAETTSTQLASSVNTSPSFVRRILSKLSKAGLVCTKMGKTGSTSLAKDPKEITLLEIYHAVEAPKAFVIHDYPAQASCPVSCGIKTAMERVLDRTQDSMEQSLGEISLAQVIADVPR
jgi:Rrf2 family protein